MVNLFIYAYLLDRDKSMVNPNQQINIDAVKKKIGFVDFQKIDLLINALTHPSYINEQTNLTQQQKDRHNIEYRRLAHLGDAILGAIVTDYLYHLHISHLSTEVLTRLKSKLVDRSQLSQFARELELIQFSLFGQGTERISQTHPNRLLSETFEALVGAIYLEFNRDFSLTREWIVTRLIKKAANNIITDRLELNKILS